MEENQQSSFLDEMNQLHQELLCHQKKKTDNHALYYKMNPTAFDK